MTDDKKKGAFAQIAVHLKALAVLFGLLAGDAEANAIVHDAEEGDEVAAEAKKKGKATDESKLAMPKIAKLRKLKGSALQRLLGKLGINKETAAGMKVTELKEAMEGIAAVNGDAEATKNRATLSAAAKLLGEKVSKDLESKESGVKKGIKKLLKAMSEDAEGADDEEEGEEEEAEEATKPSKKGKDADEEEDEEEEDEEDADEDADEEDGDDEEEGEEDDDEEDSDDDEEDADDEEEDDSDDDDEDSEDDDDSEDEDGDDEDDEEDADEDEDDDSGDDDSGDEEAAKDEDEEAVDRMKIAKDYVKGEVKEDNLDDKAMKEHLEQFLFAKDDKGGDKFLSKVNGKRWPEYEQIKALLKKKKVQDAYTLYVSMMVDDEGELHDFDEPYLITNKDGKVAAFCNGVPMNKKDDAEVNDGEDAAECAVSGRVFAIKSDPFGVREIVEKKAGKKKKKSKK